MTSNKEHAEMKVTEAKIIAQKAKYIAKTLYDVIDNLEARASEITVRSELLAQYRKKYDDTMMEACELWAKSEDESRISQIKVLGEEIVALSTEFDELTVAINQAKIENTKECAESKSHLRIDCQLSACEDVDLWFDHLENIMFAGGIKTESRKFAVLRSLLDDNEAAIIESVISRAKSDPTPYTSSKAALREHFLSTVFQRLEHFFEDYKIEAGEKAHNVWTKLDKLGGPFSRQDVINWKILQCLPSSIDTRSLKEDKTLKFTKDLVVKIDEILEFGEVTVGMRPTGNSIKQDQLSLGGNDEHGNKEVTPILVQHNCNQCNCTGDMPSIYLTSQQMENVTSDVESAVTPKKAIISSTLEKSILGKVPKPDTSKEAIQEKREPVSGIVYDEGQWSPFNPKGKRQYSSKFLLQFQFRSSSLKRPKDLPNFACVLEQPHNNIVTPLQPKAIIGEPDFIPSYMKRPPRRTGRQTQLTKSTKKEAGKEVWNQFLSLFKILYIGWN